MKCAECGFCREKCPVFHAVLKETASPRTKGILKKNEKEDKIFYLCTLCGRHLDECKLNSEEDIIAAREALVKKGVELSLNRKMIASLKKNGHPFALEEG